MKNIYSQSGAVHLFVKSFQHNLANDTKCWICSTDKVHSESRVRLDIDALYDALMTTFYVGIDHKAIPEHVDIGMVLRPG